MFQKFGPFWPIFSGNSTSADKPAPPAYAEEAADQPEYLAEQQKNYGEFIARHERLVKAIKNSQR